MAHIETWFRCRCGAAYNSLKEAETCAVSHITAEKWAVGVSGKGVRIYYDTAAPNSIHGVVGALREADLSDDIEIRRKQLSGEYGGNIIPLK